MDNSDLFECPSLPGHVRLTKSSCANRWTLEQKPKHAPDSLLVTGVCRGCPIGATNAGKVLAPQKHSGFFGCARCHRLSRRYIFGEICVSCYNRERETITGRNAKGTAPVRAIHLSPVMLAYRTQAGFYRVEFQRSSSMLEGVLRVLRKAKGEVQFLHAARSCTAQLSLFSGI